MLLGVVIVITISYSFVVVSLRLHAALTSLLALMKFVIATFGHPYLGEVSVAANAHQVVLDKVMVSIQ